MRKTTLFVLLAVALCTATVPVAASDAPHAFWTFDLGEIFSTVLEILGNLFGADSEAPQEFSDGPPPEPDTQETVPVIEPIG